MVKVDDFDERLNFASLLNLSFAHGSDDLSGVSVDTSNFGTENKSCSITFLVLNIDTQLNLPRACPNFLESFPSSLALTTTAFLPANRPARIITTLPLLMLCDLKGKTNSKKS